MTGTLHLDTVETPAGILDLDRVHDNARRAAEYCSSHGLRWRPHVKTHKSTEIAKIQLGAGAVGLSVATPREAEVMSRVTSDILLAYPPAGQEKLRRLMELPSEVSLGVALDAEPLLQELARAATRAGRTVRVLVELDAGLHRVGVQDPASAVALARSAAELDGVEFDGLLFYPGHIRGPGAEQESQLTELADRLESFYEALHRADLPPREVSGGSTPTMWSSHRLPGVTEIRSGTCIFFDREQASIGVAQWGDLAFTILATVISTSVPNQAVIDAGSKAVAKELFPSAGVGYGALQDRPEVPVKSLNEEHGILDLSHTDWRPQVGERVRIVPNHVCVSVNLHDSLLAQEGDALRRIELEARGRGRS
ncbi:MAG: alanine racemase [Gemmatimonadetes bacterium]|nr:alanine racemase [Gemmatimonadota bacterium]